MAPGQLCEQGVVGSSPIVSTTKGLVTGLRLGRQLAVGVGRALHVPFTRVRQLVGERVLGCGR